MKLPSFQGADNIVSVLLTHGEKIVIGLVAICVAWFVYSSLTLETSPVQPEALRSAVQNAQQNVEQLDSVESLPEDEQIELRDFDTGSVMNPISATAYEISVPLNPPEFPRKVPRSDPELLTIEQIDVSADVGMIAFSVDPQGGRREVADRSAPRRPGDNLVDLLDDSNNRRNDEETVVSPLPESLDRGGYQPGGQDRVEVKAWTCLMAKVPVDKQAKLYDRTFRDAEGWSPEADRPQYLGYQVQRAEVTAGGDPKWETLELVHEGSLEQLRRKWGSGAEIEDVAGPEYIHPALTYPLPRRVERSWGTSVCPDDMLARWNSEESAEGLPSPAPEREPELEGLDAFGASSRREGRSAEMDDRMPMPDDTVRRGERPGRGPSWANTAVREVPHKLFRFFDLAVAPGRRYQYRVRLVLTDPNHGVEIKYLADEVIERREKLSERYRQFVITPWSDPSPIITIPPPGELLVGPVRVVRGSVGEPMAAVVANMFDANKDIQAITRIEGVPRGTLGNFKDEAAAVIQYAGRGGQMTKDTVEFRTATLLVDIRGGEPLSQSRKGLTAPARVLMTDGQGNLLVREQASDHDRFRRFTLALQALEEAAEPPERVRSEFDEEDEERDRGRNERPRRGRSRPRGGR